MKKIFKVFLSILMIFCLMQGDVVYGEFKKEDSSSSIIKDNAIKKPTAPTTTTVSPKKATATPDYYCEGKPPNPLSSLGNLNMLGQSSDKCLEAGIEKTYIYKNFIPYFIKKFLEISSGIAVLIIVFVGIQLVSGLEESEQGKKVKTILYTLIGLIFMLLSRALVSIVENLPLK